MDHETPFLASDPNRARPLHRRHLACLALSGVAALALSACGGGGGSDSLDGNLDLRAAYDRIIEGMNHADVDRAVGAPSKNPENSTRKWESGNQFLTVGFAELNSGEWIVNGVNWNVVPGGELSKSFDVNRFSA